MGFGRDISRKEYIEICEKISIELKNLYHSDDVMVRPEPITEGGLVITGITGYKTMRHHIILANAHNRYHWPYINDDIIEEWKGDDSVLIPGGSSANTCLKAFDNASSWKRAELQIIGAVMAQYDIRIGKIYSDRYYLYR